jgi:CubicO group peptidase (beta-lactamase class C family)
MQIVARAGAVLSILSFAVGCPPPGNPDGGEVDGGQDAAGFPIGCNPANCPNGCCDQSEHCRQPAVADDMCGTGGAACDNCNLTCRVCVNYVCVVVPDAGGTSPDASSAQLDAGADAGVPSDAGLDAGEPPDAGAVAGPDASVGLDAGADAGATYAQDYACQQQLLTQWATTPPVVGMGSQNANSSYDTVFRGLMSSYGVPGGAVSVSYQGHLIFTRAYGYSDTASNQPAHPGQLFRLASVSKQFTATAILQLVQAGTLSLDASAFSYLPNLQPLPGTTMNPALTSITIRNLLNHTGGWNRDSEAVGDPMFDSIAIANALGEPGPASADDTIRYMLDKPITYTPGTTYCYSNFGYAVLGAIIEQVTGTNYPAWMQQKVMGPQSIEDMIIGNSLMSGVEEVTYYDYPGASLAPDVFPPNVGSPVPWPYGGFNMQALEAHGGWIASVVDMLRFTRGVDTYVGPPTLITQASLNEMLANPVVLNCNTDGSTSPTSSTDWYGFGFEVNQYGNYWHTGSLPGTATEDVIANNDYDFAAFFNTRPSNANGFASDLDNDLWTAFNGVSTWSADDYFDQYGSFTSWLAASAYATQATTAQSSGQYAARAEGQLSNGVPQYRAVFVPLHAGTQAYSYVGLDCVSYEALASQYQQAGLGLISLQTYVDATGLTRYQATWKSY